MKKLIYAFLFMLSFTIVTAQHTTAPKMVLMEESCAKNCGPCYKHERDEIRPLYAKNINKMAMVVYNQEPIGVGKWTEPNKPYTGFHNTFDIGYQSSVMIDRTFFPNNYSSEEGPDVEAVGSETTAFNQ